MSRTYRGGVGLRFIVGLTGTMAVIAGVLGVRDHKPTAEVCDTVPTSIRNGTMVQMNCTGLTANGSYYIASNGDSVWRNSGIGSGHGLSATNAADLGSDLSFTANSLGIKTLFFVTDGAAATDASTHLVLKNTLGVPIVDSDSVPAYNVDFPSCTTGVPASSPIVINVANLVSGKDYYFGELQSGTTTPTHNRLDATPGGTGSGAPGMPYKVDSTSSPYLTPTSDAADGSGEISGVYILTATSTSADLGIYDAPGTLIGILHSI